MNNDVIEKMEENLKLKLKFIPSKLSEMSHHMYENTLVVDSKLPSDTFNVAYGGDITEDLVHDVKEHFNREKLPMAWWIKEKPLNSPFEEKLLRKAGFVHDELDVGMSLDMNQFTDQEYEKPVSLTIKECKLYQDFVDFGKVLASVFTPKDPHVEEFYKRSGEVPKEQMEKVRLFVGYVDDTPTATAGLFLTDVAGIYDISTIPEMQKRGYGTAMFMESLLQAKKAGYDTCVLQASPDGLGIYKKYGFKEECIFNIWSNEEILKKQ